MYLKYLRPVSASRADSRIEFLYVGALKDQSQGDIGDWDVVLLARYPSRRACYEMFRSARYQQHHPLAEQASARRAMWPS